MTATASLRRGARLASHVSRSPRGTSTARPRFIEINGQRLLWKDVVAAHREQAKRLAQPEQPALFELREDHRPPDERNAAERYLEPRLFASLKV